MLFEELMQNYENGNKRDTAKRIENEYGWYDFVTDLESTDMLTTEEKLSMICSLIRISNR